MNAREIERLVHDAIGDSWEETNFHGVDLRKALVPPRLIKVIQRHVDRGTVRDEVTDAWLVLIEDPESGRGYRIVADADGRTFGLASEGSRTDPHLVLCGWYGDFWTAFKGM
ncbi:MAG: hypothetical protein IT452_12205 [Planctomycetia bacterium]|nr:hypothetical protein [Planctomycetia bacterium]